MAWRYVENMEYVWPANEQYDDMVEGKWNMDNDDVTVMTTIVIKWWVMYDGDVCINDRSVSIR